MPKSRQSRRRHRPAAGPRRSLPPLPASPPPHVVAFVDQLDAAVAAGELPDGQRWHLDVAARFGAADVDQVAPRLCTAPDFVPCLGGCAR